jgi:hypothetical protein
MNPPLVMMEMILAGFLAVACIRASVPAVAGQLRFTDLLRFPSRIERLRRSRWQWSSMVALLLALRLQSRLPMALEAIVALEFLIFLAVPTRAKVESAATSMTAR